MAVTKAGVVKSLAHLNFPSFLRQRHRVTRLDLWNRGLQNQIDPNELVDGQQWSGQVFTPEGRGSEHQDLETRAPTGWAGLIVRSLAQTAYVDGVRMPQSADNMKVWQSWQRNGWDARQISLHRDTIAHGLAFGMVLPGRDPITGDKMSVSRPYSARKMAAFFDEEDDEWPRFALKAEPVKVALNVDRSWHVQIIDETAIHYLSAKNDGREVADWTYISYDTHPFAVPPVVRFANSLDLEGRATGVIEPAIPLLRRIDQDTFDRMIVQRFGAWKVRYIAGMAKPSKKADEQAQAMILRIQDLLVSDKADTKFGTLDATDIKGFLESAQNDLREVAAVSQIPPHHLLGLSSNLQAEALASAEAGLMRQSMDFRTFNGEAHEKMFRLDAMLNGYADEARAYDMQVRWRDTESRSLMEAAQALTTIAGGLGVPVEMLWERLPDWTDADSERARKLIETGGVDQLLAQIAAEMKAEQGAGSGDSGSGA